MPIGKLVEGNEISPADLEKLKTTYRSNLSPVGVGGDWLPRFKTCIEREHPSIPLTKDNCDTPNRMCWLGAGSMAVQLERDR